MRLKMSLQARKELFENSRERYHSAGRKQKSLILNELTEVTGLHRKYITSRLGTKPIDSTSHRRRRAKLYSTEAQEALIRVWEASNRICSKRLAAFFKPFCSALERHGHLQLSGPVRAELLKMSPATIDRYLFPLRDPAKKQIRRSWNRAPEICKQIPIRTFTEWDSPQVGGCEIDLVAHCGTNMGGSFIYSFVLTDVSSGWTEMIPLLSRDQGSVIAALYQVKRKFPFPIHSLDADGVAPIKPVQLADPIFS
jgi:hypothetical protein